jgi:transposase
VQCVIAAPGKIERPSSDRVKTDQRDAERLLRLLMIDGLHAVRVPSTGEEALRDLVGAREDIRGDLMRARHRMSKLLLRHDVRFDGSAAAWTTHHRAWLSRIDLGDQGAQVTLLDYLGAIDALLIRRAALEAAIDELIADSPWAQSIARLRCLRGIDTLSAVGLCAEIGDWQRFPKAGHVMSYLGLVASEDSTGSSRRQGAITKTGSGHGRRLLVKAAWHYRRPPRNGACTAPASAWTASAASAARSSPSLSRANSPGSAGRPPTPTETRATARRSRRRRERAGTHAREHPRSHYEQPFRRPRSILDSGLSRRNTVLANEGSAHISLTTVAHTAGPAAPLDRHDARQARASGVGPLTKRRPYQWVVRPGEPRCPTESGYRGGGRVQFDRMSNERRPRLTAAGRACGDGRFSRSRDGG